MNESVVKENRELLDFDKLKMGQLLCKKKLEVPEEGRFQDREQLAWNDLFMYHGNDKNLFTVVNLESEKISTPKCRESYEWQFVTEEMVKDLNNLLNNALNLIENKKLILERNNLFKYVEEAKNVNFSALWLNKFPMKDISNSLKSVSYTHLTLPTIYSV